MLTGICLFFLSVQAVYRKLKASLVGKVSEQTIEPLVYPIDWTHNPICLKEQDNAKVTGKTHSNADVGVPGAAAETDGSPDPLEEATTSSISTDSAATATATATATAPKTYGTKFIEGKSMETGSSSFDQLARDAPFDFVVLTDCVFAKELAVPLVNSILCCCGPRTTVICCHEIRDEVSALCTVRAYLCCFK